MQISQIPNSMLSEAARTPDHVRAELMEKAGALEAVFLSEMLAHAGLGQTPEGAFSGGIGEEQFASFLRQEQATQMVRQGGIGLAEHLFHAMTRDKA